MQTQEIRQKPDVFSPVGSFLHSLENESDGVHNYILPDDTLCEYLSEADPAPAYRCQGSDASS